LPRNLMATLAMRGSRGQSKRKTKKMKTMTASETVGVNGGIEPISASAVLLGAVLTVAGFLAKDIHEHWGAFKDGVADGWNNV